jgi:hypothetical protein
VARRPVKAGKGWKAGKTKTDGKRQEKTKMTKIAGNGSK